MKELSKEELTRQGVELMYRDPETGMHYTPAEVERKALIHAFVGSVDVASNGRKAMSRIQLREYHAECALRNKEAYLALLGLGSPPFAQWVQHEWIDPTREEMSESAKRVKAEFGGDETSVFEHEAIDADVIGVAERNEGCAGCTSTTVVPTPSEPTYSHCGYASALAPHMACTDNERVSKLYSTYLHNGFESANWHKVVMFIMATKLIKHFQFSLSDLRICFSDDIVNAIMNAKK